MIKPKPLRGILSENEVAETAKVEVEVRMVLAVLPVLQYGIGVFLCLRYWY